MKPYERAVIIWCFFTAEAVIVAMMAAGDSGLADIAFLVGLFFGVPIASVYSVLACTKKLGATVLAGTTAVGVAVIVSELWLGEPNPLVIGAIILLAFLCLPLLLPSASKEMRSAECEQCGYPIQGLKYNKCPECGSPCRTVALITPYRPASVERAPLSKTERERE